MKKWIIAIVMMVGCVSQSAFAMEQTQVSKKDLETTKAMLQATLALINDPEFLAQYDQLTATIAARLKQNPKVIAKAEKFLIAVANIVANEARPNMQWDDAQTKKVRADYSNAVKSLEVVMGPEGGDEAQALVFAYFNFFAELTRRAAKALQKVNKPSFTSGTVKYETKPIKIKPGTPKVLPVRPDITPAVMP